MSRGPSTARRAIEVWAPDAGVLALDDLDAPDGRQLRALTRDPDGTWWTSEPPAGRYWLVLDGDRIPDPRSTCQPEGFDGPSAIDDGTHGWTDHGWRGRPLDECVIYELHVGTFGGPAGFDGVIERLDHLVDLGVGAIELMPVHTFPGERGWGYDPVQLSAPHAAYGGPQGLRRLVDACHARGLAVVMDVVYNHAGPLGNHLPRLGPYAHAAYTPWGDAVNLDGPGSDAVRRMIVEDAVRWIDVHHLDGLRIDAVHAFVDRSAVHIVEEIAAAVHAAGARAGRTTWVIAESDLNDPRVIRDVDAGGYGCDASWSDDFHHALHVALTGDRHGWYADFDGLADVADALEHGYVWRGGSASFRGRRHGRPLGDLPRGRLLGYSQTHDQVGNRALGERLCHLVRHELAELAAGLVLTGPFVPMLFQGEEWAASTPFLYFTSHPDDDLGRAVREGRRKEFAAEHDELDPEDIPDPQAPATFERSTLRWAERDEPEHRAMLDWYRALVALRRAEPDLRTSAPSDTEVRRGTPPGTLVVRRGGLVVAVNLGDTAAVTGERWREVLLANRPEVATLAVGGTLAPHAFVVARP